MAFGDKLPKDRREIAGAGAGLCEPDAVGRLDSPFGEIGRTLPAPAAEFGPARLRRRKRCPQPFRDQIGLILGERREHMDGEAVCVRKIHGDEVEAAFHQLCGEAEVARQTVEAGDDQRRATIAANPQRLIELRAVVLAAAYRFGEFADELSGFAFDVSADRSALCVEAEFRFSLARRRDAI